MPKQLQLSLTLLLTTVFFAACSDDDKETTRVAAAAAVITHNPAECPKVSGLYRRKEGFTEGVLGFSVVDNGNKLVLASESTGIDGHTFILDGKDHEEVENGQPLKYTAGCNGGKLTVVGSIGNGQDKIDMEISEKAGGTVVVKSGDAEGEYVQVIGQ